MRDMINPHSTERSTSNGMPRQIRRRNIVPCVERRKLSERTYTATLIIKASIKTGAHQSMEIKSRQVIPAEAGEGSAGPRWLGQYRGAERGGEAKTEHRTEKAGGIQVGRKLNTGTRPGYWVTYQTNGKVESKLIKQSGYRQKYSVRNTIDSIDSTSKSSRRVDRVIPKLLHNQRSDRKVVKALPPALMTAIQMGELVLSAIRPTANAVVSFPYPAFVVH
ncbi:hypothetical protein C8R44DRAFT_739464 [Mycena epipterygia]|nr:hypothetical protein C8R44DRAFT_739464 [Mycena epipterygia]